MSRSDSDIGVGAPPPLPADILQQAMDAADVPTYDADDEAAAANYVDPALLAAMNLGSIQIPANVGVAAAAPPAQAPSRTVRARPTLTTRVGTATTSTRTTVGHKRPRRRLSRRLHRQAARTSRSVSLPGGLRHRGVPHAHTHHRDK